MRSIALLVAAFVSFVACSNDGSVTRAPSTPLLSLVATSSPNDDLQWGPAPPIFPKGAEIAVLQGDPSKTDEFTVRLRFPNGYKLPAHTHPTIENVTVLKGTFLAGMGDKLDESKAKAFGRDAFVSIPANTAHFAIARGQTIVQVHAIGPFQLTYVNPADDPTRK
ncbi:MAG TPA: cupin domain-containing protein [Gemmatimonadaceae bacterium]|jgi:quercetin dioxygenase-like cupin family protein